MMGGGYMRGNDYIYMHRRHKVTARNQETMGKLKIQINRNLNINAAEQKPRFLFTSITVFVNQGCHILSI